MAKITVQKNGKIRQIRESSLAAFEKAGFTKVADAPTPQKTKAPTVEEITAQDFAVSTAKREAPKAPTPTKTTEEIVAEDFAASFRKKEEREAKKAQEAVEEKVPEFVKTAVGDVKVDPRIDPNKAKADTRTNEFGVDDRIVHQPTAAAVPAGVFNFAYRKKYGENPPQDVRSVFEENKKFMNFFEIMDIVEARKRAQSAVTTEVTELNTSQKQNIRWSAKNPEKFAAKYGDASPTEIYNIPLDLYLEYIEEQGIDPHPKVAGIEFEKEEEPIKDSDAVGDFVQEFRERFGQDPDNDQKLFFVNNRKDMTMDIMIKSFDDDLTPVRTQEIEAAEREVEEPQQVNVKAGDTMNKIAQQHGISTQDLINANPQVADPNLIFPEQKLTIPVETEQQERETGLIPFLKGTDSSSKQDIINSVFSSKKLSEDQARSYGEAIGVANWQQYVGMSGIDVLKKANLGQSPAGGAVHVVSRGDTMSAIAQKYGVELGELIAANPQIQNPNLIYPNQKITVPTVGEAVEANDEINKMQEDIMKTLGKTNGDSVDDVIFKISKDKTDLSTDAEDAPGVEMTFSFVDKYKELFETDDIKELRDEIKTLKEELDELDVLEMDIEKDIRSQVEGEAPASYVKALAIQRSEAFASKKRSLTNKHNAVVAQLNAENELAGKLWDLTIKDRENALNYLETFSDMGLKLDAATLKQFDESIGVKGFSKLFVKAKKDEKKMKSVEDELDMMKKIMDMQAKLPVGKSFSIGGAVYESTADPNEDVQTLKETDAAGNVTIVSYRLDEKGKPVILGTEDAGRISKGFKATGTGPRKVTQKYFKQPDPETGEPKFYFGDPRDVASAQEVTKKQYLVGVSDAASVLRDEEEDRFLSKEYFEDNFTEDQLKQSAKDAGLRSVWTNWETEKENYLDSIENSIKMWRNAGFSDKEIFKKMQG